MKIKDLKDKRAKLVTELRAMNEKPAGDDGDLSTEQRSRFDTAKAEIDRITAQIERQEFIDEVDRRASGEPVSGSGDHEFETEKRKCNPHAFIAMQTQDIADKVDCGRERAVSRELEIRGMKPAQGGVMMPLEIFEKRVTTTALPAGGPGSNLIATDHRGDMYVDTLRAAMIVAGLGARPVPGLQGNVTIPARKTSHGAQWIAENSALTADDAEYRSITMSPKHVGCLTEMSRNMILQTSPELQQITIDDFRDVLAQAIDRVALQGGGSNEPTGILQTGSIGTFDGSTWAGILSALEDLGLANALIANLGWAMNPSVQRKLRSTLKVSGDAGAGFIMENPNELAGYRAAVSNNVPGNLGSPAEDSALIFGNWSDLIIGYWSAIEILVNPYETTAYKKGNVQVRGLLTADVAVRHAESFTADQTFSTVA